jgi:hypothetical protein
MRQIVALAVVIVLLQRFFAFGFKPPMGAVIHTIGAERYYSGEIYLASHEDTLALRKFGFRNFEFQGRALRNVSYHVLWPTSVVIDSLPTEFQNINFELAQTDTMLRSAPDDSPELLPDHGSPEEMPTPKVSSEQARAFMGQIHSKIPNYPRPYDNKPDTVIDGRSYAHGWVYMKSIEDSAALNAFGFFGFDPKPRANTSATVRIEGTEQRTANKGYAAYWPFDVDVNALPHSVHQIVARRFRTGVGEVTIDRKTFDE